MTVVYLVHDLADPAVARRLRILSVAGIVPVLLGFRRGAETVQQVGGVAAIDLGRTTDSQLLRRIGSVIRAAGKLGRYRARFAEPRLILARNLEMLVLAYIVRARFAPSAGIVFECLDIHASLVSSGLKGRLMRAIERGLLRYCVGLVVSSPGFVTHHFAKLGVPLPPIRLIENKVLASEFRPTFKAERPLGPPWRIGWFGIIRCRRSLALLAELVRRSAGQIEVDIRGRPVRHLLPDFDTVIAATPGLRFYGAYDRNKDLAAIYSAVHFTWAMDFYEAGANSDWLLPNRLYEGLTQAAIPLALHGTQTGIWLTDRAITTVLSEPLEQSVASFFEVLDRLSYGQLRSAVRAVDHLDSVCSDLESQAIGEWLLDPN